MSSLAVLLGITCYAGLSLVAVLCGRGILRLGRVGLAEDEELALAPVVTFLGWTLILAVLVAVRVPIRNVAPPLWLATFALALYGCFPAPRWFALWPVLLCLVVPVVTMRRAFGFGLLDFTPCIDCDGWSYGAGALYLWHHPRGADGGLVPIHTYGASMKDLRWVSYSLLAFQSGVFLPEEPHSCIGLYQAWLLFTLSSAAHFAGRALGLSRLGACAVAGFTVLSGWVADLLWTNNLDNTASTVYLPALAGVLAHPAFSSRSRSILLGLLLAGALYTYPECAPFFVGPALLIALPSLVKRRPLWRHLALGGGLAVALVAPGARDLVHFARDIYEAASWPAGYRPGDGWFAGLTQAREKLAAFWALGGECHGKPGAGLEWGTAPAVVLTGLLLLGLVQALRQRRWGVPLALLALALAAGHVLYVRRYEYAAYKLLVFAWWPVVLVTVGGGAWLVRLAPGRLLRGALACALVVAAAGVGLRASTLPKPLWDSNYHGVMRQGDARALRHLSRYTHGEPVLLAVDDWLPNLLAIAALREPSSFYPACLRKTLSGESPTARTLESDIAPLECVRYVLTDSNAAQTWHLQAKAVLVWSRGPYHLWQLSSSPGEATLSFVSAGLVNDPERSFWVADSSTTAFVHAGADGVLRWQANISLGPGPTRPEEPVLRVTAEGGWAGTFTVTGGPATLNIPVRAGVNRVTFTAPTKKLFALSDHVLSVTPGSEQLAEGRE